MEYSVFHNDFLKIRLLPVLRISLKGFYLIMRISSWLSDSKIKN